MCEDISRGSKIERIIIIQVIGVIIDEITLSQLNRANSLIGHMYDVRD